MRRGLNKGRHEGREALGSGDSRCRNKLALLRSMRKKPLWEGQSEPGVGERTAPGSELQGKLQRAPELYRAMPWGAILSGKTPQVLGEGGGSKMTRCALKSSLWTALKRTDREARVAARAATWVPAR